MLCFFSAQLGVDLYLSELDLQTSGMLAESGAEHLSWGIRSWALLVLFVPGEAATMGENAVPSNMAELLVVRHGETSWNVLGRLQGHAESDLNEAGKKQAQAVKFAKLLKLFRTGG